MQGLGFLELDCELVFEVEGFLSQISAEEGLNFCDLF